MTDLEVKVVDEQGKFTQEEKEHLDKLVKQLNEDKEAKRGNPMGVLTLEDGEPDCRNFTLGELTQIIVRFQHDFKTFANVMLDNQNELILLLYSALRPNADIDSKILHDRIDRIIARSSTEIK